MADLQFKMIEQVDEIADGDYILTVHDGEIKKVAKADANVGGGSVIWFTLSNDKLYYGTTGNFTAENCIFPEDIIDGFDSGSQLCIYYPYNESKCNILYYQPYNDAIQIGFATDGYINTMVVY